MQLASGLFLTAAGLVLGSRVGYQMWRVKRTAATRVNRAAAFWVRQTQSKLDS
jgi:hypothetical protein